MIAAKYPTEQMQLDAVSHRNACEIDQLFKLGEWMERSWRERGRATIGEVEKSPWLDRKRWPQPPPDEYWRVKRELRQAKLIAAAITGDSPHKFSAVHRAYLAAKGAANSRVRHWQMKLAAIRKKYGIADVKFWKPRSR